MKNTFWTFEDYQKGDCSLAMVNTPKPEPEPEQLPEPDQEQSPVELLSDDMFEHEFAEYMRDRAAYKARNAPALVVKLLATAEDRRIRSQAKPAYAVDTLTPRVVASMTSEDLKRFVLHRTLEKMSEAEQAAALAGLEPK